MLVHVARRVAFVVMMLTRLDLGSRGVPVALGVQVARYVAFVVVVFAGVISVSV